MQNFDLPLSDQELDQLGEFLLDRVDEDAVEDEQDEGILNISTLDGFMTALVSGPETVLPSQWLPAVWGEFEPEWASAGQLQDTLNLMMRHMNGIVGVLIEDPEQFEPIFLQHEIDGKEYTIVDDWCEGYLRGMALHGEAWVEEGECATWLEVLRLFATETGWDALEAMSEDEIVRQQQRIAPNVRSLHAYWLQRRSGGQPFRREAPKPGRNALCPCGSGKKFKKCCGAAPALH